MSKSKLEHRVIKCDKFLDIVYGNLRDFDLQYLFALDWALRHEIKRRNIGLTLERYKEDIAKELKYSFYVGVYH